MKRSKNPTDPQTFVKTTNPINVFVIGDCSNIPVAKTAAALGELKIIFDIIL